MKIVVLLPYANPHVLGWVQILRVYGHKITIGCVESTEKFRPGYFENLDSIDNVLYLFKGARYSDMFRSALSEAHLFISLGLFDFKFIKSLYFLNNDAQVYVLSEPFNPVSSSKKYFLRRLWVYLIKSFGFNIQFLAIGGKAVKEYYQKLGFKNSLFFNFGYFPKIDGSVVASESKTELRFLFVGQLIERKGVVMLIQLLDYLNTRYTQNEWRFDIVGDGPLKDQLLNYLKKFSDKIKYHGKISDRDSLEKLFSRADVFFLPSLFDGWGAVVNEAVGNRCSLLISNKVYSKELLLDENKNGFSFNPKNFEELKKHVDVYFSNSNKILLAHIEHSEKIYRDTSAEAAASAIDKFLRNEPLSNSRLLIQL